MMTHLPRRLQATRRLQPPRRLGNGRVAAGRQHGGLFMANLGYTAKKNLV